MLGPSEAAILLVTAKMKIKRARLRHISKVFGGTQAEVPLS